MNAAVIAGIVVLALLTGAALPVLAQARVSLRAWQRTVEEAGPRLNRTLDEVSEVATRLRRELAAFDGGGERVASALGAVDELGRAALELRRTVKVAAAIGAAVGPGIAAAVRTMREPGAKVQNNAEKENHHEAA
jgi:ABC-type transporter Mla subunit MlaD